MIAGAPTASVRRARRVRRRIRLVCLCGLLLTGCSSEPAGPPPRTERVERGPFAVELTVTPAELAVGDSYLVTLTARTPTDYAIRFPEPAALEGLDITETADAEREAPAGADHLIWRKRYRGVANTSGEMALPELTIAYGRPSGDPDDADAFEAENALVTPVVRLDVRSALSDAEDPTAPRDITGVVAAPPEPLSPWTIALWSGVALLLAATLGWAVRRAILHARRPPPPVAPEVRALRALAELESSDIFATRGPRPFYYRLSEIVRAYIEDKFDVAAPEMTTEEFLLSLATGRSELPYDRARLRELLEHCDLVKYAAFEPAAAEGGESIRKARAFVNATAAAAATQSDSAAANAGGRAA